MERIINLLNNIENKAERILSLTEENKKELSLEHDKKIQEFNMQLWNNTDIQLQKLYQKIELETEQEITCLRNENNRYLNELGLNFQENFDSYVNEIFHRIIAT